MTRLAVLGPGGVGGFLAAAFTRAGEQVTVVAREETAAEISRGGIEVRSAVLGDFRVAVRAVARLAEPVDVLFVATKATGLEDALDRIEVTPALVVPLLNGLDHLQYLRERLGADRVAAGVIRIEADRPTTGRIVQTSPSVRVDLAAEEPEVGGKLSAVADALTSAGIPARIGTAERQIMWSKLVRLNALASTTSVADRSIGFIRTDPAWRATLIACIEETAAIANADGGQVKAEATLLELDGAHEGLGSSMQRDLAAGRLPELDAIQGSVLRAAARHHLTCPTVASLARAIAERAGLPVPLAG